MQAFNSPHGPPAVRPPYVGPTFEQAGVGEQGTEAHGPTYVQRSATGGGDPTPQL